MEYIRLNHIPDRLTGKVHLPSSKSLANRALIIQALCDKSFEIENLSIADDTVMMEALLFIQTGRARDCGNTGTAMRFMTAYLATQEGEEFILKGGPRMHERPIGPLVEALRALGAEIRYMQKEGYPPLHIHGKKLSGNKVTINAGMSSQFVTAILLIAPLLENGLEIKLEGEVASAPYIRTTLGLMEWFGIKSTFSNSSIRVFPGPYQPRTYKVESDWSAAAYFFAWATLLPGSELVFDDLYLESLQGDSRMIDLGRSWGLAIKGTHEGLWIRQNVEYIKPSDIKLDLLGEPDLIPTVVCYACAAGIPFEITGTRTLDLKESKRAKVLQDELGKLGYVLHRTDNSLTWRGEKRSISSYQLYTHDDHRMAMAFALLAVKHPEVLISDPVVVGKSFPHYWEELNKLGIETNRLEIWEP